MKQTKEKIRKTGIDIIGNVPWGSHFCLFYKTKKDLIDILVPYFQAGLENNEFCMWITSEPFSAKEAKKAMRKAISEFDRYLKRGQIEIIPHTQWYLKDRLFDSKRAFKNGAEKLRQALLRGYDGLRGAGNTSWLKKRDWRNFVDYEKKANKLISQSPVIALCAYPLDKHSATKVINVVYNHQFALIRRDGQWKMIKSAEHEQAKEVLKQKVKEATYQLKEQHKAQENLFTDLAHELKTPLTILKGNFGLALGKNAEKVRKNPKSFIHFLAAQKEEVDRVEKTVNGLFILAKAETNQFVLQFQKLRLDKLIEKVCLRLQTLAEQEKKKLLFKKLMPLTIKGDRQRLEQLVSNLLDNAIKFTKPKLGQIQVSLTTDRGRAKIRVKDNGIGIPEKDLPHIFERFYRSSNTKYNPTLRGTGLGLSVCEWIVKKHHGKITVRSIKKRGTVFTVLLPLASY